MHLLRISLAVVIFLQATAGQAEAERTLLSEPCNATDTTVVWFEAFDQTVTLSTTTKDGPDGNIASRRITFQDGRSVDLPPGSNFLYDATGISCETYIAVAKSSVLFSMASGQRFLDLHDDYKALLRGENPCNSPDQSDACSAVELETIYITEGANDQLGALTNESQAILDIREHPFGTETYVLSWPSLALIHIFYRGS